MDAWRLMSAPSQALVGKFLSLTQRWKLCRLLCIKTMLYWSQKQLKRQHIWPQSVAPLSFCPFKMSENSPMIRCRIGITSSMFINVFAYVWKERWAVLETNFQLTPEAMQVNVFFTKCHPRAHKSHASNSSFHSWPLHPEISLDSLYHNITMCKCWWTQYLTDIYILNLLIIFWWGLVCSIRTFRSNTDTLTFPQILNVHIGCIFKLAVLLWPILTFFFFLPFLWVCYFY